MCIRKKYREEGGLGRAGATNGVRHMQEKYENKGKKLYCVFIEVQRVFDGVHTEVVRWALYDGQMCRSCCWMQSWVS